MADFINKMREKPTHVRKMYAFWASAGITAVIALIWVSTLPARFAALTEPKTANAANQSAQVAATGNAPIDSLSTGFTEGIQKLKGMFSGPKLPEPETVKLETNAETQSALSGAVLITDPSDAPDLNSRGNAAGSASVYIP